MTQHSPIFGRLWTVTTTSTANGIMCGIHATISPLPLASAYRDIPDALRRRLTSRGPDHFGQITTRTTDEKLAIQLTSTVLSLRGSTVTKQPFVDETSGSTLCWNGEAWKISGRDVDGNDGEAVFRMLSASTGRQDRETAVLEILRSIEGPFAFVYFDRLAGSLFFGRDRLGRRSLLMGQHDGTLALSSVAEILDSTWREVEADGIYVLRLGSSERTSATHSQLAPIRRHAWTADLGDDVVSAAASAPLPPSPALARKLTDARCLASADSTWQCRCPWKPPRPIRSHRSLFATAWSSPSNSASYVCPPQLVPTSGTATPAWPFFFPAAWTVPSWRGCVMICYRRTRE